MSETEPSHHLDIVREVLYTEKKNVKHTFSIKLSAVKIHMLVIILYKYTQSPLIAENCLQKYRFINVGNETLH